MTRRNKQRSQTAQARKSAQRLETLLTDSITLDYRFNWQSLRKEFPEPASRALAPQIPVPTPFLVRLVSTIPFLLRLPPLRRYHLRWTEARENDAQMQALEAAKYSNALGEWHKAKESYDQEQASYAEAEERKYLDRDRSALLGYWGRVLEKPVYLEQAPCVWDLKYSDAERHLIVEYALPLIGQLPRIEEVRYRPDLRTL